VTTPAAATGYSRSPIAKLDDLFNQVRAKVYSKSRARQLPWASSSVIGEFIFGPPLKIVSLPSVADEDTETVRVASAVVRSISNEPAAGPQLQSGAGPLTIQDGDEIKEANADLAEAISLLYSRKYAEAIKSLTASLVSPATRPNALRLRAIAYAGVGLEFEARRDLTTTLQEDKQGEYATHNIGCIVNIFFGQLDGAIAEGLLAAELRRDVGDTYLCLANAYYLAGRYPQALEAYSRASALQPPCQGCEQFQRELETKVKR
jgi:tetratricopeptide (TPR) repeat protein